jgi:hypothetical protein
MSAPAPSETPAPAETSSGPYTNAQITELIKGALRSATALKLKLDERAAHVFDVLADAGAFWPAPDVPVRIELGAPGAVAYELEIVEDGVRIEYNGNGTAIAIEIDQ